METFLAVSVGIIAVEIGIMMAALVFLVFRVRRTAEAVEVLAYRVEEQVESFGSTMRSGWMKGLQTIAGVATGLWSSRRHRDPVQR